MASIRTAAQDVLDEARDGIAWIALYRNGRGWTAMTFWPDDFNEATGRFTFEDFELEELRRIVALDPNAILVNSYYYNLGDVETMTRDSLADALRWQYDIGHALIIDVLRDLETEKECTPWPTVNTDEDDWYAGSDEYDGKAERSFNVHGFKLT